MHSGQRNRTYSGLCQLSEGRTPSQNKEGRLSWNRERASWRSVRVGKVSRDSRTEF